jgi:hypothetical protein
MSAEPRSGRLPGQHPASIALAGIAKLLDEWARQIEGQGGLCAYAAK